MKKRKLNYRLINPNTEQAAADHILKILIEANASKVEQAIRAASWFVDEIHLAESHPE